MAKKKQTVKRKGVFDYLNQITKHQKKGFWESLSDEDKKGWSTFLVNRFLSMRSDFLPIVNEVQKYSLKPELIYKTYMDIIPKGNYYLRYIKGKKKKNMDYPNWMINVVSNDLQVEEEINPMKDISDTAKLLVDGKMLHLMPMIIYSSISLSILAAIIVPLLTRSMESSLDTNPTLNTKNARS